MNIGLGARRRTILLIDADAQARAILRTALEAADFSVGEAASNPEGERTILRVKPDIVLADLLADPASAGLTISEWLRAHNDATPCYVVSTAGEALAGAVGLHELGITGVFLKPVDTDLVVQTLRTQLCMPAGDDGHA
jgi:DNA-binding response OmpR family regulator